MGACCSLYGPYVASNLFHSSYSVGLCSMRGDRQTNEDAHTTCLEFNNHPGYSFFGVFDGHNGDNASNYLSNHLVDELDQLIALDDDQLVIDALNKMDQKFLKLPDQNQSGSTIVFALIKTLPNSHVGGSFDTTPVPTLTHTTACINNANAYTQAVPSFPDVGDYSFISVQSRSSDSKSLINPIMKEYETRIFWVGDSGAILMSDNNNYNQLTVDHHCDIENDLKRIKAANGIIINKRIDGNSCLSRSFGCISMKNNNNLRVDEQKQICVADVKHVLCRSGEHLILHSDGLTAKWSLKQVISKYNYQYDRHGVSLQNTLKYLIEECIDEGSKDNVTVITIKFK